MSEANASTMTRMLSIDRNLATLDDVRIAYVRDLREKAAGRGGDGQAELTMMRVRESRAKAISLETQNLERTGQLVPVDEIEPLLEQWVIVARAEVGNAVRKILADIQGQHDIDIEQSSVDSHLAAAYRLIGAYPGRNTLSDESDADGDAAASRAEMDTAAH
jgi:hypothetical protein